jgi:soluble lytic murein transglycosylase-like protein
LRDTEITLKARQGELELARLELARVHAVMGFSSEYRIPADLAAQIYDIALAEGIEPRLAYRLVRVESGFFGGAISHMGAVGLTQVMPATARELDPTLAYADLFHQETNLRLGFRYHRKMLVTYPVHMRLSLLAYNRGPGTVDKIRRAGGDPANGYERAVMGGQ